MKDTLLTALDRAGAIQMERFNISHTITLKESVSSIVTEVDYACDNAIMDTIRQHFPNHNILTEESGMINKHSIYTWVIDPLDGTSNYAAGIPWFGVLIALFEKDLPVMAGAFLPFEDKLFFASRGHGSWLNDKRLAIPEMELSSSLFAFSADNDEAGYDKAVSLYGYLLKRTRNIRSTNCLIDFLHVVEGKTGGCINLLTRIWDIAAPYLLIREAGGTMKMLNGEDIAFEVNGGGKNKIYQVVAGPASILRNLDEILHQ
jgi:myo-inositol-1(or 4)-monophosphatase